MQDLLRQPTLHGPAQQALFLPMVVLEGPGNPVQVLGNAIVAEGHPDLQGLVHAHPVLPVQESLHEPAVIKIHHFLHTPLRGVRSR